MELTDAQLFQGACAAFVALVAVLAWPPLGFFLVLTIPIFKGPLRMVAPGIMQSFTYDVATVCLAFLGAARHRVTRYHESSFPLPAGFVLAYLVLLGLVWLRLPASHAPEYGMKKALIFSGFTLPACLAAATYLGTPRHGKGIVLVTTLAGLISVLGLLIFGQPQDTYRGARVRVEGSSPLYSADLCAFLVLTVTCFWMNRRGLIRLILLIVFIPASLYAIFLTGTRGALLPLPLVMAYMLWVYRKHINVRAIVLGAGVAFLIYFCVAAVLNPDILRRFEREHIEEGIRTRLYLSTIAIEGFVKKPVLGNGTGDTAYQITGMDTDHYPHNHVLEVANEFGILGLLAYLLLLGYALRGGITIGRAGLEQSEFKRHAAPLFAVFLYLFIISFKQSNFTAYTNHFFMTCVAALGHLQRKQATRNLQPNPFLLASGQELYAYSKWGRTGPLSPRVSGRP